LMTEHMQDCVQSVQRMRGKLKGRLILDSEMSRPGLTRRGVGSAKGVLGKP